MKAEWKALQRLPALLERFKYPIGVLLLGLALVLLPVRGGGGEPAQETAPAASEQPAAGSAEAYRSAVERELESLLSQMEGAGRVRVMLTLKTGPAARYQSDRSATESRDGDRVSASTEEKTVMLERGSAYNEPAIVSTAYPVFQGALVVAEGGGDERVRLRLSGAVAALLGLGADQIIVVKMK